jgi:hypothetical protein
MNSDVGARVKYTPGPGERPDTEGVLFEQNNTGGMRIIEQVSDENNES